MIVKCLTGCCYLHAEAIANFQLHVFENRLYCFISHYPSWNYVKKCSFRVRVLYGFRSAQCAFYTRVRVLYSVRSPQSVFYTDRTPYHTREKVVFPTRKHGDITYQQCCPRIVLAQTVRAEIPKISQLVDGGTRGWLTMNQGFPT